MKPGARRIAAAEWQVAAQVASLGPPVATIAVDLAEAARFAALQHPTAARAPERDGEPLEV
ncbi:MAG TPA: hypothetical protein VKH62_10110 [Candidatus Binatia bacterium]|nr:hypothetical protein [Candidatus Binatia bacterium]